MDLRTTLQALHYSAPPGARGEIEGWQSMDVYGRSYVLHCKFCKASTHVDPRVLLMPPHAQFSDPVYAFAREHWHVPPRPLTPEEKERVKVLGVHRRGAWRLAARGG